MTGRPLAISVDAVTKDFRLPSEQRHTLKERVVNPRFDRTARVFHALRDVSFEAERGEFFGIVGRNGSGKSTLLKCMAGIYKVDGGEIRIGGRLSTFIELGVGFNPDLAARDNIILNGIMLGLSPKQAAARVDEVIAFAELEDHVDLKLKNYSSGMQVRLAFSVMTQVDADVLLIDEVLAVGDAAFQAKCFDIFRQLREAGKTIVLVTHDMATVARFCDRAMLVEDGEVVMVGEPEEIGDRYLDLNFERHLTGHDGAPDDHAGDEAAAPAEPRDEYVAADTPVSIVGATVLNADNQRTAHIRTGETLVVAVDVVANADAAPPLVQLELRDELDRVVFATDSQRDASGAAAGTRLQTGDRWRLGVWVEALLQPGQLRVRVLLRDADGRVYERSGDLARVEVTSVDEIRGIANLPHGVRWDSIDREFMPPELRATGGNRR